LHEVDEIRMEPSEDPPASSDAWPRLPTPPRSFERWPELVSMASDGNAALIWQLGGGISRHDMRSTASEIVRHTQVGTPVLVIHHPFRIHRHLAYLPGQFAQLAEIMARTLASAESIAPSPIPSEPTSDQRGGDTPGIGVRHTRTRSAVAAISTGLACSS
jgi:hypothetical protein